MKPNALLLTIAACALAAPSAMAQSNLGIKGLGVSVAFVSPENLDGTVGLGVYADCGTIAPHIGLETRLDYWSESRSDFGVDTHIHDVALGVRGKYNFEVANPRIQPFAGAGLGLHIIGARVDVPAQPGFPAMSTSDSQTKLGLDLGGGIATPVGPRTTFLGELWYGIVTDVSQLSIRAGLSYKLGS